MDSFKVDEVGIVVERVAEVFLGAKMVFV